MSPIRKPNKLTKEQLEHPNSTTYTAWNGDQRPKKSTRWNKSPDFEDRESFNTRVSSHSENAPVKVRSIVNGQVVFKDPSETASEGHPLKLPTSHTLQVGGLERNRHEPTNCGPTTHSIYKTYSPLAPRRRGKPAVSELTVRKEGTDGKAE